MFGWNWFEADITTGRLTSFADITAGPGCLTEPEARAAVQRRLDEGVLRAPETADAAHEWATSRRDALVMTFTDARLVFGVYQHGPEVQAPITGAITVALTKAGAVPPGTAGFRVY